MRLWLLMAVMSVPLCARAEPIVIDDSQSPDGKYFLTIEPHEPEGVASGTAEIRLTKAKKIVGTFEWEGFGELPNATAFTVLWNKDSNAFAIFWEITRGYCTCAVYARTNGVWQNVNLPDYGAEIRRMEGKSSEGKGFDKPMTWLTDNELEIKLWWRTLDHDDFIYLGIGQENGRPAAKILKIRHN